MQSAIERAGTPRATREKIRSGAFRGVTSGLAPGYVQANLVVLPIEAANEFRSFCLLNPKPCPILAVSAPGDPRFPTLGAEVDARTDVPRYRIWRNGDLVDEVDDVRRYWQDDMVAFALGCSYTFEHELLEHGVRLKHIAQDRNVAMYRTSMQTVQAGKFRGPLVVSMRPLKPQDAIRAIQVSTRYPLAHGAPVHIGAPESIGIRDLMAPDYGDAIDMDKDELPVFWACGVTPQAAIVNAKPPICITHTPGCMLITDIPISRIALM